MAHMYTKYIAVWGNVVFETLHDFYRTAIINNKLIDDFLSIFLNESKKMYLCTAVHLLKRTRPSGKVHVCSCPTSAEKLLDFSAEVGEVLWSVFKTSLERLFFALSLIPADKKNYFFFNGLKNNSLKSCV
jgi:hypothetical protein